MAKIKAHHNMVSNFFHEHICPISDNDSMSISPEISEFLRKPIAVGGKQVDNRLWLAPMAGFTHVAFRELLSEFGGCGLLFSEMCSAKAVPNENPAVSSVFRWSPGELPNLVCQIFGAEPEIMAAAAERIEKEGFFGVDINFGCSVAAICKQGAGAAVLKDPQRAVAIVGAVRRTVSIPLFVKFRTGWTDDPTPAADLARRFEDAGADALVFHPRVAPDRRSRPPRWPYIRVVKQNVTIPVFGNGDVFDVADRRRMISETGCDGISLGRIALARPWLFAQWTQGWVPDADIYRRCAHRMLELVLCHYEPITALRLFKKWVVYYTAGFKFGHQFGKKLRSAADTAELKALIDEVFGCPQEMASRPNMNLFR